MTNLTLEHRDNYLENQQYKKELKEIEEDFRMFHQGSILHSHSTMSDKIEYNGFGFANKYKYKYVRRT